MHITVEIVSARIKGGNKWLSFLYYILDLTATGEESAGPLQGLGFMLKEVLTSAGARLSLDGLG